jgi:hypothetical protein
MDECEALARSDQVILPPAAELDGATAATPVLPIVETVSNDDFVDSDAACTTTHRPIVWDIAVVKSDVPDAPQTWMWTRA